MRLRGTGSRIPIGEVVLVHNTVINTIAVRIGTEEGMIEINAGIDNYRGYPAPVHLSESGILPCLGHADRIQRGLDRQVTIVNGCGTGSRRPGSDASASGAF